MKKNGIAKKVLTILILMLNFSSFAEQNELLPPRVFPDGSKAAYGLPKIEGDPCDFEEVWGYVMRDREYEFTLGMPVTDLCYFGADINSYGEITSIPNPSAFKKYKGRKHFVVTCESRSLSHFVLDPQFKVRQEIIKKICDGCKQYNYDGVQIDFELVPKRDAENFRSFLEELGNKLGSGKMLTVALPARVKNIRDDVYPYKRISPLVDRIIVMAYDEHWSTSAPGAIAGMDWCRRIADYSVTEIPAQKLVMGLPFYGRTWESVEYGKAWYYSGINRIMNENDCHSVKRTDGVPYFTMDANITVTGYFDDTHSLVERCRMYQGKNINKVAFWRIGQEDPSFWEWIRVSK